MTISGCSPEAGLIHRPARSLAREGTLLTIDGYAELEPIGRGGLGDVYRAVRRSTGATVAIKVLRDVSDTSVAWTRCRRELAALVALGGHAHVIGLVEQLDLASGPALVMEHAPGGSVADLVARRGGPLTVAEAALVGEHTADALVAAHARGIVHRDVKPQNLLIDAYGQVKLCDFGIAAVTRSPDFQTRTSGVSLRYASPEDLDDDGSSPGAVGPPADVYSLGATLLYVARGVNLDLRDRLAPWEPPSGAPADLAALDAVVAGCLRPDPADRPTAGEVLQALDRIGWSNPDRRRALPVAREARSDAPSEGLRIIDPELDALGPPPTDLTLARPHSRRRERVAAAPSIGRPLPSAPSARVGRRVAVAVGAVVLLLGVWWLTRGTAPAVIAPAPSTVQPAGRPAGLPELTDAMWPAGPVGECLVQRADSDTLAAIACSEPHDLERVAAGTPPLGDVDAICVEAAAEYLAAPPANLGMSVAATTDGDAGTYQCFVGIPGARLASGAPTSTES